jgi:hypothetical protein
MLLSWIGVSLHHVLWRWQSAIEAVENEIKSSSQIVFMRDRSDLMADDPQFSLSKTYFWALQAYKLFEETLLETITTWNKFKSESLPRLDDPRMCPEDRQTSIDDIDDAIKELEAKVARIKKRYKEVKDLRTGLESASALFDGRTTVRQGENVRLLTYITILFVPLSLGTVSFLQIPSSLSLIMSEHFWHAIHRIKPLLRRRLRDRSALDNSILHFARIQPRDNSMRLQYILREDGILVTQENETSSSPRLENESCCTPGRRSHDKSTNAKSDEAVKWLGVRLLCSGIPLRDTASRRDCPFSQLFQSSSKWRFIISV